MTQKTPDDLDRLSDQALLQLEDELLLRNELATSARSFFSPGRLVIFFLGVLLFLLWLLLLNSIFAALGRQNNPLSIFVYVGCLAGGVFAAEWLWRRIGVYSRYLIRIALHYWPVTFQILISLVILLNLGFK
ncbi:MAG: hypothetical protein KME35_15105 [Aphanocapsa sp. GSE-SYN-MK-11-07L]|jgi:hypothetical protein|nr:hypothetical protein [Aphanocapsa sp. GSE-SYN-MK-11-07L]